MYDRWGRAYLRRPIPQTTDRQTALFGAVKAAYERGLTKSAIAREYNIDRRTVRKYLHMSEPLDAHHGGGDRP